MTDISSHRKIPGQNHHNWNISFPSFWPGILRASGTVPLSALRLSCKLSLNDAPYSFRMVAYSRIRPPGMKRRIHHQPPPCKQRPPGSIRAYIYAFARVIFSFSPPVLISPYGYFVSHERSLAAQHKRRSQCDRWSRRWNTQHRNRYCSKPRAATTHRRTQMLQNITHIA